MKWFVLEKNSNFNLPEWARTFGIDDNGVVFIPAAVTEIPEDEVYQRLETYSDIPMAQYCEHFYMPSGWLAQEFPAISDLCQMFEIQAKKVKVTPH